MQGSAGDAGPDDGARRHGGAPSTAWVLAGGAAALAFFLLVFLAIADGYVEHATIGLDTATYRFLVTLVSPLTTRVMWIATIVGDTRSMTVETIVAASLFAIWGRPKRAAAVLVLMTAGPLCGNLLKVLYARSRPPVSLALIAEPGSNSFPSGHSIAAMLLFGGLAAMLVMSRSPRWAKLAGVAAGALAIVLVGMSRVYLGVHWASDVLASWSLGAAFVAAVLTGLALWERTATPAPPPSSGVPRTRRVAITAVLLALAVATVVTGASLDPLL